MGSADPCGGLFGKALVCTDLSTDSTKLVNCASQLHVIGVHRVVLTHVVDVFDTLNATRVSSETAPTFEEQMRTLEDQGITVDVEALSGHPSFSLREAAERHGVSLIIIGSNGRGIFKAAFSGSTSSDLTLLTDKPLLLGLFRVLGEAEEARDVCGRVLEHVLFATDFSDNADRAFGYLRELVCKGARRVTLLHVRSGEEDVVLQDRSERQKLERLRRRLLDDGAVEVEVVTPQGDPAKETARFVRSGRYSLVVTGAHGHRTGAGEELGSVSDAVVRHATAPLLLVPALRVH